MQKNLLTVADFSHKDFLEILALASQLKQQRATSQLKPLAGKTIGMIFAKSSTRTRVSFEVGIHELGGYPMFLDQSKMQLGRGESIADTAKVLGRYLHGIVIRTYEHSEVEELAKESGLPVINALTNQYHPCQILTDLFTIYEHSKTFSGVKLVYCGDGSNNMANSFILGAALSGIELVISSPEMYKPDSELLAKYPNVSWEQDPQKAVQGADYIYTDVWVSMGFEEEKTERFHILQPYQVNMNLLRNAKENVKLLHCLPAHRGEEISAEVMDSPYSIVFDQAENRLHTQKAILTMLFKQQV